MKMNKATQRSIVSVTAGLVISVLSTGGLASSDHFTTTEHTGISYANTHSNNQKRILTDAKELKSMLESEFYQEADCASKQMSVNIAPPKLNQLLTQG